MQNTTHLDIDRNNKVGECILFLNTNKLHHSDYYSNIGSESDQILYIMKSCKTEDNKKSNTVDCREHL